MKAVVRPLEGTCSEGDLLKPSPGMTLGLGPTAPAKRARIWASPWSVLASLPLAFIAICCQKGNSPPVISNMG